MRGCNEAHASILSSSEAVNDFDTIPDGFAQRPRCR